MSFYRLVKSTLSLALRAAGGFAVFIAVVAVGDTVVLMINHPDFFSGGHGKKLPSLAQDLVQIAAVGGAMIWAGRRLRYYAFPKADPRTAATAEYAVYGSGAPGWVDALAVGFVSLGFFGLMYLTSGYNPSAFIPRLILGFGAVYLFPRVWLTMNNEASRDLRWKLRRFFPDKPLLWDTGPCLCIDGQQIPWNSISAVERQPAPFKYYIAVTTQNPWAVIKINVALALQSPDAIRSELWNRWIKKGAGIASKVRAQREAKAA